MKSKKINWRDKANFLGHFVQDIDISASAVCYEACDEPTPIDCFESLYNEYIIHVPVDISNKYDLQKIMY